MQTPSRSALAGVALAVLLAPIAFAQQASLSPERAAIVETARRFAAVRWKAEPRHLLHGDDGTGVRVDTPDVSLDPSGWTPGAENVGMPYCWGGFTGLDELEDELAQDRLAGHVPARGNSMGSRRTIGVDCSGLVSRAWNLPVKQSTRSLGALCYELDGYEELLPGDIVNRFDAHVALFDGWADEGHTALRVIEAARIKVDQGTYTLDTLRAQDYRPMRYKPLDERWRPMPGEAATAVEAGARRGFAARDAAADLDAGADPLPEALRAGDALHGDWARYDATESGLSGPDVRCTWMAVEGEPTTLRLQRILDVGPTSLATGAELSLAMPWPELLSAFGNFSDPLRDLAPTSSTLATGTYRLGERELPARKLKTVLEGQMLSRSTLYPVRIEVECVLSDDVPLFGVCEATLRLEVEYGMRGEERVLGRQENVYALTAFGRAPSER